MALPPTLTPEQEQNWRKAISEARREPIQRGGAVEVPVEELALVLGELDFLRGTTALCVTLFRSLRCVRLLNPYGVPKTCPERYPIPTQWCPICRVLHDYGIDP